MRIAECARLAEAASRGRDCGTGSKRYNSEIRIPSFEGKHHGG